MWYNTTPVPNEVLERWLFELSGSEYKVLMTIIRKTLGWKDEKTLSERKECDWISNSQFQAKTNLCKHVIVSAIHALVVKNVICVMDEKGNVLDAPCLRRGKMRLYFRLSPQLIPISAKNVQGLSKKVTDLGHKMHYTKY